MRPDRVPQMAGAEDVVEGIERRDGTEYSGLVLNEQGAERFAAAGLDRLNATLGATEEFNRRNGNATLAEATASGRADPGGGGALRRRSRSASPSAAPSKAVSTPAP